MATTKAYDDLVEGFRAKISGNIESKKMTSEETAQEIAQIQDGAVSSFEQEGNIAGGVEGAFHPRSAANPMSGYVTKSGRVYKNKPGRPKSGEK